MHDASYVGLGYVALDAQGNELRGLAAGEASVYRLVSQTGQILDEWRGPGPELEGGRPEIKPPATNIPNTVRGTRNSFIANDGALEAAQRQPGSKEGDPIPDHIPGVREARSREIDPQDENRQEPSYRGEGTPNHPASPGPSQNEQLQGQSQGQGQQRPQGQPDPLSGDNQEKFDK